MKQAAHKTLALLGCLLVLSCNPMDRHYNSDTWVKDVREASTPDSDSINRAYCGEAIAENEMRGIDNTGLTYGELIKQGITLAAKKKVNAYTDSLGRANGVQLPTAD